MSTQFREASSSQGAGRTEGSPGIGACARGAASGAGCCEGSISTVGCGDDCGRLISVIGFGPAAGSEGCGHRITAATPATAAAAPTFHNAAARDPRSASAAIAVAAPTTPPPAIAGPMKVFSYSLMRTSRATCSVHAGHPSRCARTFTARLCCRPPRTKRAS